VAGKGSRTAGGRIAGVDVSRRFVETAGNRAIAAVKELFAQKPDELKELTRAVMQELLELEAEMTDALGAPEASARMDGLAIDRDIMTAR
jgi:hypothetical protein